MPSSGRASIVEYFAEHEGYKCGYCKQENTNFSHGMWGHVLTPMDYQDLIDRGWRRSGQYCYKPTMARTCCPLFTIKCAATKFQLSKSQKKVLKKFRNYLVHGKRPPSAVEDGSRKVEDGVDREDEETDQGEIEELEKRSQQVEDVLGLTEVQPLNQNQDEVVSSPSESTEDSASNRTVVELTEISADKKRTPNPGVGADPSKPQSGKAKALRKARRQARQASQACQGVEARPVKEAERSVDSWLGLDFGDSRPEGPVHTFTRRLVAAEETDSLFAATFAESLGVYQRYQQAVHGDSLDKCNATQFKRFLCKSPLVSGGGLGSFHQHYLLDGKIIAVGVIDILPRCVSSVYLYYDPAYQFLSLGTFTSLMEVELVRSLSRSSLPNVTNYYLGFYIHSCPKMRYKGRYSPSYLACPETYTWQPLANCVPLLDASRYSRLDPDPTMTDPEKSDDLSNVGVLFCREATTYRQYRLLANEDEKEQQEVAEYVSLVGISIAKRMLLYRSE